jgi:hypothetical protein
VSDNWMSAKYDDEPLGEMVPMRNMGPEVPHLRRIPDLYNRLRKRQLTPPAVQIMQAVKDAYRPIKEASKRGDRTAMVDLLQDLDDAIKPMSKAFGQQGAPNETVAAEVNELVGAVRSARNAL